MLYVSGLERDFLGQDDRDRVGKYKRVTRGLLRAAKLSGVAKESDLTKKRIILEGEGRGDLRLLKLQRLSF